jgi:hypothetical protein
MGLISLNDIKPGMVLAAEVKDRAGRVLLAAGQEISEKHLKIFKTWGVTDANIEGASQEDMVSQDLVDVDPEIHKKAEELVMAKFRHAGTTHPGLKELARLATMRQMREMSGGSHGN